MTATYIHDGDIVDHIPANDLPCGAVVVLGTLVGIAHRPIPAGALGSLALEGVWDLPSAGVAGTAWAPAFWNPATNMVKDHHRKGNKKKSRYDKSKKKYCMSIECLEKMTY